MSREVHIQIFEETHKKLKILSSVEEKSMKEIIMEMVNEKFKEEWGKEFRPGATMRIKIKNIEPEKFKGKKVVRL